jgi:hypothetical protein
VDSVVSNNSAKMHRNIPNRRHVVLVSSAKNATNSVLPFDTSEIANEGSEDPTN